MRRHGTPTGLWLLRRPATQVLRRGKEAIHSPARQQGRDLPSQAIRVERARPLLPPHRLRGAHRLRRWHAPVARQAARGSHNRAGSNLRPVCRAVGLPLGNTIERGCPGWIDRALHSRLLQPQSRRSLRSQKRDTRRQGVSRRPRRMAQQPGPRARAPESFRSDQALTEAVQRILDRIVFVRVCEARGVARGEPMKQAWRTWRERGGALYPFLVQCSAPLSHSLTADCSHRTRARRSPSTRMKCSMGS